MRIDSDNNGAQQREAFFPTLLAKRPDVQLDKLENDSPGEQVAPILAQAHVYQIGASRQITSGITTVPSRSTTP